MPLYKQDPNNTEKQVIKTGASRAQKFPARKAILPTKEIIYNRADAVIVNNTGSYAFLYTTTGSSGGTSHYNVDDSTAGNEIWVTGYHRIHDSAAGHGQHQLKLVINPVACFLLTIST